MRIAYVEWVSLIDFPGKVAAVVWTVGCNLRCPFCYNGELVLPERAAALSPMDPEGLLSQLAARRGFVDGLAVTGGEPTLQPDLADFLAEVKGLGLAVKLDTNGTRPEALAALLKRGLLDYVALDLKAPFPRYPEFTGVKEDVSGRVRKSVQVLREGAPDYELRTTVAPGLSEADIEAIAQAVRGAKRYVLQPFFVPRGKGLIDPSWAGRPHLKEGDLRRLAPRLSRILPCSVRA
ncbi:MAG: anaerobic ribonucleoside-triphosphate reductase activating protein [Acetothermia bacterium 64_32]|nr:MAG: anaerobic ribonucleoside-triphosphate reductase activating protein [Acetothermia bacterium 64_32]MBC7099104.1 anaerobic ribonucleoside-triphosphate reductase activating protein [Candidatus Bipolaricaulota bacterium]HAF70045.1 anaerobic ribonucleoside-triphosphate reductase activating protein [Candidatus Acetothermia bacterium]